MRVVTLILILAGSVRADDFERLCRARLTAIYAATMAFAADHDGCLPPAHTAKPVGPLTAAGNWFTLLAPYLEAAGWRTQVGYRFERRQAPATVFHCPANPYWYGGYGPWCGGYVWNRNLGVFAEDAEGAALIRLTEVAAPARTILAADSAVVADRPPYCHYLAGKPAEVGAWHDGKANVLFLDGHIEALAVAAIDPDWFAVRPRAAADIGRTP